METVIVIGGGASGLIAALTAAEDKSRRVIVLERQQRIGRKLLATGNGRCNLTNTGASPENYHGRTQLLPCLRFEKFPPEKALSISIPSALSRSREYGGRVYPLSNSANSVLDVLRFALEQSGVEVKSATSAREIYRDDTGWAVVTDGETLHCDKLIVACGGAAGAKSSAACPTGMSF